ncbi:FUSC family protein [Cruoricaptor ignavus]|uniref:FUSC family protein n=1 Tax=Cruoricaptor ignavus TaxID=1118202 RepID=UPI00370CFC25
MEDRDYSNLTDEQLLNEEKQLKSFSIMNAFLIGFLIGIIFISIKFSAYNISLIIPLFLIYKFFNDPRNKKVKELEEILKERKLK